MKTSKQVEKEFKQALLALLNEYNAELFFNDSGYKSSIEVYIPSSYNEETELNESAIFYLDSTLIEGR